MDMRSNDRGKGSRIYTSVVGADQLMPSTRRSKPKTAVVPVDEVAIECIAQGVTTNLLTGLNESGDVGVAWTEPTDNVLISATPIIDVREQCNRCRHFVCRVEGGIQKGVGLIVDAVLVATAGIRTLVLGSVEASTPVTRTYSEMGRTLILAISSGNHEINCAVFGSKEDRN